MPTARAFRAGDRIQYFFWPPPGPFDDGDPGRVERVGRKWLYISLDRLPETRRVPLRCDPTHVRYQEAADADR